MKVDSFERSKAFVSRETNLFRTKKSLNVKANSFCLMSARECPIVKPLLTRCFG